VTNIWYIKPAREMPSIATTCLLTMFSAEPLASVSFTARSLERRRRCRLASPAPPKMT
jgi:hypothetical protein